MGVTTRDFPLFLSGVSDLEDPKNASHFQNALSPSRYWAYPEQIHGSKVHFLSEDELRKGPPIQKILGADGLFTHTPQTTLSILTADCLPIFFLVPDPLTIGLIHAGWRGTAGAIAHAAVGRLQEMTHPSPETFHVAFGPCIRSCCYQVGEELKGLFGDSMTEREGALYLDLVKENRRQLEKAGMKEENISDHSLCTACHAESFYSYRRDKEKSGRMVSWIRIQNVLP